jgi:hypothetical protein
MLSSRLKLRAASKFPSIFPRVHYLKISYATREAFRIQVKLLTNPETVKTALLRLYILQSSHARLPTFYSCFLNTRTGVYLWGLGRQFYVGGWARASTMDKKVDIIDENINRFPVWARNGKGALLFLIFSRGQISGVSTEPLLLYMEDIISTFFFMLYICL